MDSSSPLTTSVIECPHCGRSRLEWSPLALTAVDLQSIGQAALDRWYAIDTERKKLRAERQRES